MGSGLVGCVGENRASTTAAYVTVYKACLCHYFIWGSKQIYKVRLRGDILLISIFQFLKNYIHMVLNPILCSNWKDLRFKAWILWFQILGCLHFPAQCWHSPPLLIAAADTVKYCKPDALHNASPVLLSQTPCETGTDMSLFGTVKLREIIT